VIKASEAARVAVVVAELLQALMRRYNTTDPAAAAGRMLRAMREQDRLARIAEREHAARRAQR
jgi:hypothetical protein